MDQLWAPWRMELIEKGVGPGGCIFCDLPREGRDRENLILGRTASTFTILNRFPYNNGHLMVVPRAHVAGLDGLSAGENGEPTPSWTSPVSSALARAAGSWR